MVEAVKCIKVGIIRKLTAARKMIDHDKEVAAGIYIIGEVNLSICISKQFRGPLVWPLQGLAADDIYRASQGQNIIDYFPCLAGQGMRLLKGGQSAGDIVTEIVEEANAVLANMKNIQ